MRPSLEGRWLATTLRGSRSLPSCRPLRAGPVGSHLRVRAQERPIRSRVGGWRATRTALVRAASFRIWPGWRVARPPPTSRASISSGGRGKASRPNSSPWGARRAAL